MLHAERTCVWLCVSEKATLFRCYFHSVLSSSLLSCLFDFAKFRAVTLSEGFWQHSAFVEDSTGPCYPPAAGTLATKAQRSSHMTCPLAESARLVRLVRSAPP